MPRGRCRAGSNRARHPPVARVATLAGLPPCRASAPRSLGRERRNGDPERLRSESGPRPFDRGSKPNALFRSRSAPRTPFARARERSASADVRPTFGLVVPPRPALRRIEPARRRSRSADDPREDAYCRASAYPHTRRRAPTTPRATLTSGTKLLAGAPARPEPRLPAEPTLRLRAVATAGRPGDCAASRMDPTKPESLEGRG